MVIQIKFVKLNSNFFRQITPEERRTHLKKEGLLPPMQYNEAPMFLASTGTIFDPYIPPEGDGRSSILSKEVCGVQSQSE